jgi:hypothetical protein
MIGNIPPDVIANDSFYTPLEEGNFSLTGSSTVNLASGNTVAYWSAFLDEAALPDRPGNWIGVVLGNAAANAALTWTAKHPAACDLVPMHLARVEAVEHGLTMWETAALLTDRSTSIC